LFPPLPPSRSPPVAALAAGDITTQNGVQIAHAIGRSNDHAAGYQQATLSFNGTSIPVTSGLSGTLSGSGNAHDTVPLLCGTCAPMNQTGGGGR
jgi:hypothetical protein